MTASFVDTIRAIVRDELARVRPPELGIVTAVHALAGGSGDENHQVDVRLRASGVELQRAPVTVQRLGVSALPAEGDLVVVAFLGGDLNAPIVIGCVYDDEAHPPEGGPAEVVYVPPEDEESSVRRLHVELPNGSVLSVEDEVATVELGGTRLVVNHDGDVEITAAGAVTISAGGDIELSSDANVTLSATGDVAVKATGSATLEGTGGATVKGPQVKLAGTTSFSPS